MKLNRIVIVDVVMFMVILFSDRVRILMISVRVRYFKSISYMWWISI